MVMVETALLLVLAGVPANDHGHTGVLLAQNTTTERANEQGSAHQGPRASQWHADEKITIESKGAEEEHADRVGRSINHETARDLARNDGSEPRGDRAVGSSADKNENPTGQAAGGRISGAGESGTGAGPGAGSIGPSATRGSGTTSGPTGSAAARSNSNPSRGERPAKAKSAAQPGAAQPGGGQPGGAQPK